MSYLLGLGHDVALESLLALVPQPSTVGYQYASRSYAASGAIIDELPHVEFRYVSLGHTVARYRTLLTQFGLLTAKTALVTVYIQDENYDWVLRNGTAVKPQIGSDGEREHFFLRGFVFIVKDLRVTA